MKKSLIAIGLGITLLAGCGSATTTASADMPKGYYAISKVHIDSGNIYEIVNKETTCHFTYVNGDFDTTVSIAQMFVEKNGVSVPYCEK